MKKSYRVPDMHCVACAMRLEALEDQVPGVRRIDASYRRQQLVVEFDDGLADLATAATE